MSVRIDCPNPGCGASATVAEGRLGREARCTRCGERFALIPGTRADPSPPSVGPVVDLGSDDGAPLPSSFGRFRVVRELGRGGMGAVYLAEDAGLGRLVALKVPHPAYREAPGVRERLLREARAAARFRHPNFCPIHDIGEVDGVPYLGMSYIEGRTLASLIEPGRPWPGRRAAEVARKLAGALAEAHRRGVVHRDLKPANVMVDRRGRLVLMDFGLALRLDADDPRLTATGAIVGTPAYMPPEQVEGDHDAVGPRSDIYSLGVILYELLAGRRPFEGSAARVLGLVLVAEAPPPSSLRPGLDPRLEAICLKAMARHPEDRHASMGEFAAALLGWLAAPSGMAEPESGPAGWPIDPGSSRIRLASPRRPAPIAGLAAASVLAASIAAAAWVAARPGLDPSPAPAAVRPSKPDSTPPAHRCARTTPATPGTRAAAGPAPEAPAIPDAPPSTPSVIVADTDADAAAAPAQARPAGKAASSPRKPRHRPRPSFQDEPTIILVPVEVPVPMGRPAYPPPPPHPGGPPGPPF